MSFLLPQCISDCLFGRAAAAAASSQPAAAKAEAAKEPSFKELLHLSDDRIVIEFADGPEIYDVSLLQQFPFFHFLSNANEKAKYMEHATGALLLKQFDRAAFRIAIELQIKKMPFHQVITKADLVRNPGLLESCDAVLNFLDPHPQEEQQKALEGIMESTKPLINVEWALAIVEAHDGKLPEPNQPGKGLEEEESSSSSSSSSAKKEPFFLTCAREVLLQSKTFASDVEARKHFDDCREFQIEKEQYTQRIQALEASFVRVGYRNGHASMEFHYKAMIEECNRELAQLLKRVDMKNLSMIARQHLAAHIKDANPAVREAALQAEKQVAEYREKVLAALRENGADMARADLLEYLVGPKGYLFDHYGFQIEPNNRKAPFTTGNEKSRRSYSLKDNSVFDLEDVISDAEFVQTCRNSSECRPRFVTERICTKQQTQEVQALRKEILPILKRWDHASTDEHTAVKQKLLDVLKWDPTEVTTNDIRLSIKSDEIESNRLVIYFLNRFRGDVRHVVLNLWDCSTLSVRCKLNVFCNADLVDIPPFKDLKANDFHNEYTSTYCGSRWEDYGH